MALRELAKARSPRPWLRHLGSGTWTAVRCTGAVGWKALRDGVALDRRTCGCGCRGAVGHRGDVGSRHRSIGHRCHARNSHTGHRSRRDICRSAPGRACGPRPSAAEDGRRRLDIVMEGRDIGTVVFPHADVKIYLDAAPEERARRRANDPAHTGGPAAVSEVATLLTERDRIDSTRTVSPLYVAADAIVVDTTGRSIDEVVEDRAVDRAAADPLSPSRDCDSPPTTRDPAPSGACRGR